MLISQTVQGKDDFLGRTEFKPLPKMNGVEGTPCKLLWHQIIRGEDDSGEILAACELFLVSTLPSIEGIKYKCGNPAVIVGPKSDRVEKRMRIRQIVQENKHDNCSRL